MRAHTRIYTCEYKCLMVKYILAGETSERKVEESEAYWGVVYFFPVVSPLSKPLPTTAQAQAQTPNPLCASSLSLYFFCPFFLFLRRPFYWLFFYLYTPFTIQPFLLLPFIVIFSPSHSVSLLSVSFLPALCLFKRQPMGRNDQPSIKQGGSNTQTNHRNQRIRTFLSCSQSLPVIKHSVSGHHLQKPLERSGAERIPSLTSKCTRENHMVCLKLACCGLPLTHGTAHTLAVYQRPWLDH